MPSKRSDQHFFFEKWPAICVPRKSDPSGFQKKNMFFFFDSSCWVNFNSSNFPYFFKYSYNFPQFFFGDRGQQPQVVPQNWKLKNVRQSGFNSCRTISHQHFLEVGNCMSRIRCVAKRNAPCFWAKYVCFNYSQLLMYTHISHIYVY